VNCADLSSSNILGILEGESQDAFGGFASDELDALHNTVNNNVLDTRVFSLGVFSDQDGIDAIVWSLVADD
jgi:hypothetical protein